jgi:hypothetical protein
LLFLVPVFLLVACGFAGFIWWQYYKTTPAYSLALLVDASQRDDTAAFDELFDLNRVVENFVSDVAQNREDNLGVPDWLRSGLQSVAPGITETIKPIVREGIKRRIQELGEQSDEKPFVLTALGVLLKANIFEEGNKATAAIIHREQSLELKLERTDRQWKVVSVKDDALAARIMADIAKELPGKLSPAVLPKPLTGILPTGIP